MFSSRDLEVGYDEETCTKITLSDDGASSDSDAVQIDGSTVTITVEPEDGFQLADLTVTDKDGNELPLTDKGDGKFRAYTWFRLP